MKEQKWKRKEYETWDEAFRALAPIIRQQSVRVASYTQVLFVQACASSWGKNTSEGAARMVGKYAELAYKCGMYHQLGKALVPTEYQIWQRDFTAEEIAVYQKYTTDGCELVTKLQERSVRKKPRRLVDGLFEMDNIPWLMVRESCQQHMERYDGSGYPEGLKGDQISPIAQIVGLAKELDRLVSETKSEAPFDEAYAALVEQSGTKYSPTLIKVLTKSREKCRAVYEKYINYTMTIPATIPLVDKKRERPMGLSYYPVIDPWRNKIMAYEGIPWFKDIDDPAQKEDISQIEAQLQRLSMIPDMSFYFMYEAADTLLRIQNCKLDIESIVLQMIPSFYTQGTQLQRFLKLWEDQGIDKSRLILTIPQSVVLSANKETTTIINRYIRNGVCLMLDDWTPDGLSLEKIKEFGFKCVRPAPSLYLLRENADMFSEFHKEGIAIWAKGVDDNDIKRWLAACDVKYASGAIIGMAVTEDELIRENILRERSHG